MQLETKLSPYEYRHRLTPGNREGLPPYPQGRLGTQLTALPKDLGGEGSRGEVRQQERHLGLPFLGYTVTGMQAHRREMAPPGGLGSKVSSAGAMMVSSLGEDHLEDRVWLRHPEPMTSHAHGLVAAHGFVARRMEPGRNNGYLG